MNAVLDTKANSAYDDEITRQYHFPTRYRAILDQCIGEWVVFREPREGGGSMAYFAVARVDSIEQDPNDTKLHYARLSGYLPFDSPVPFAEGGTYAESAIRDLPRRAGVGFYLHGKSVRLLSFTDFSGIIARGFSETLDPRNAVRLGVDTELTFGGTEPDGGNDDGFRRRVVQVLVNRKLRDAAFRGSVCRAYDSRCAFTGLRIINGGGRAEVQAAHIWSVGDGGPDTVRNGVALSATAHWLFDRHLISVSDDYRLLVNEKKVPPEYVSLLRKREERIILPSDERFWPSLEYVSTHRAVYLAKQ